MANKQRTTANLIADLSAASAPKRRKAAMELRKFPSAQAGPYLLQALKRELPNKRQWETQYHMILALALCEYQPARAFLRHLITSPLPHMVALAAGDALVRLEHNHVPLELLIPDLLSSSNPAVAEGTLRALALLRIQISKRLAQEIIGWTRERGFETHTFWTAAAAVDWSGPDVKPFLAQCLTHPRNDVRTAAAASLAGERLDWRPL